MTIRFHCNECQSRVKVPDGTEGKKVKCPRCGNVQRVPEHTDDLPRPGKSTRDKSASKPGPSPAPDSAEQEAVEPEAPEATDDPPQEDDNPLAALAAAAGGDADESQEDQPEWEEPDAEDTGSDDDQGDEVLEDSASADEAVDIDHAEDEEADEEAEQAGGGDEPDEEPAPEPQHDPEPEPEPEPKPKSDRAPTPSPVPGPADTQEKPQSLGKPKTTRPRPSPQPAGSPRAIPLSSHSQSSYHPPAKVNPQSEQVGGEDARSREAVSQAPPAKLATGKPIQPPGYPALQAVSWVLRVLAVLTLAMGGGMSVPLFNGGDVMLGLATVIVGLVLAAGQLALGEGVSALRDIARNSFFLRR